MPENATLSSEIWCRYVWCRDNGHAQFVEKADKCDAFFRGKQWDETDLSLLRSQRRPALTVNKILSTVGNIVGDQINNRSEIAYRPRGQDSGDTANALTMVFKQIADNNKLDWLRSDVFCDGIITSRGFYDARISFNDQLQGEVALCVLNPKNVIVDPDASEYDPDDWGEVFVTKWLTCDDIAVLYDKEDAESLRARDGSTFPYGFDSIEQHRDTFSERRAFPYDTPFDETNVRRSVRVIERQYRKLDKQRFLVDTSTGDMRPIPAAWDRNRIAAVREQYKLEVMAKQVRRIRWTVIADDLVLHDDWSPYKHFTVIPYFPYFRHGHTVGAVENLIGPQELLNKVLSQELHVVNTSANSGWKLKAGALKNMSIEELEQRGAQTGVVIELDDVAAAEKIQPNTIPSGLDRISEKAEQHINTISGVSDSMRGFDRADVAAKAIQYKRQAGSANYAKPLDSLVRTDFLLARNVLDLIQGFYSEPRVMTITADIVSGAQQQVQINQMNELGEVLNDLTIGEYDVVISSVPSRETLEDSQFDQAMSMREAGIAIPDTFIIENSRLMKKRDILQTMAAQADSPEAQQQQQLQMAGQQAEVRKTQAEAAAKEADTGLRQAKAQKEIAGIGQKQLELQLGDNGGGDGGAAADAQAKIDYARAQAEMALERERFEFEKDMKLKELELKRREVDRKADLERMKVAQAAVQARAQQAVAARSGQKGS